MLLGLTLSLCVCVSVCRSVCLSQKIWKTVERHGQSLFGELILVFKFFITNPLLLAPAGELRPSSLFWGPSAPSSIVASKSTL